MGIWVGRYAIADGQVQEHGPWLAERGRADGDADARLLVLTEPVDERSGEFCHEVASAVAELFARETLSITGGLLRALEQAHGNLAEWNRRSLREHQVSMGVTCVVIREQEATIAQVGPGSVYLWGPDGYQRLTTNGEPSALPLGGSEPVEPVFRSVSLENHQLLLVSSEVESVVPPAEIASTLASGPERSLAELFMQTREISDMTAVLVAEIEGAEAMPPAPVEVSAVSLEEPPRGSSIETLVDGDGSDDGGAPRSRVELPALRRARVAGSGTSVRLPWRAIGAAALALLLLVAVVRFALPPLLAEDREARLAEALTTATESLDAVSESEDAVERRALLESALTAIASARSISPDDTQLLLLDARAASVLVTLDAVVEVEDLREILDLQGQLTVPANPRGLVAGRSALWLLDEGGGRVFRIDLPQDGGPAQSGVEVYRSGQRYGGAVAGQPLAIAWDAAGERLLTFDARRTLFAISLPEDADDTSDDGSEGLPRVLPVRGVADVPSVQAIAAYSGNLYLLDAEGGEVWRYLPAGDGYDSERGGLLGGIAIDDASAIAVDSDIFLLGESGGVRRFQLGVEQRALLRGLDAPPASSAAVAVSTANGRVYIADRGGQRVVVSARSGDFVAQYRHPRFFDLRGLTLSADGTEVLVLTGDGIFAFDVDPDPTAPGR